MRVSYVWGLCRALTVGRYYYYRFAVKAVEHAQVRPGPQRVPPLSDGPTDLLEPAREDPSARFEAHKVTKKKKTRHRGCAFILFGVCGLSLSAGRHDDEIYEHTMRDFPEFATAPHASLVALDEEWMKSKEGKGRWRTFIEACVMSFVRLVLWTLPSFFF